MKALLLAGAIALASQPCLAQATRVTPLMVRDLADIPGKEGALLLVEYAPGAVDPVHRHDAHVFVHVLEGTVTMQVQGNEAVTLRAGQGFHEVPADVHVVGRNASMTEPARFLAFFVKNRGAPFLMPMP
jgi:quercetin dioxygenase-like cupin family protein